MLQFFTLFCCFISLFSGAQTPENNEFTYNEFLGFVKKYHPLVRNANLEIAAAQANLLMARGGFDPKVEVDFDKKQFKDKEYYSLLNSSFKIPTWYGIEVKAGFDNAEGIYVSPENVMPNSGLTSLGISVPVGQGLFINQRMADLRKAKININLSKQLQKLEAIEVLYDASIAYFNWKKTADEVKLYQIYNTNAEIRFEGVKKLIAQGDKPAIDSVEAAIVVKTRKLSLEDANLKLMKAKLELSNFLWSENNVPLEVSDLLVPEIMLEKTIQKTIRTNDLLISETDIINHPKMISLQNKIDMLDIDRKFKANMLLPKLNVSYNYLSEPAYFNNFSTKDYKIGLNFYIPIFLRKERGAVQLSKIKLQESKSIFAVEKMQLSNKISAQKKEISSLQRQRILIFGLTKDSQTMLNSEERLYSFGESSLFLINNRENNLVAAQLTEIALDNRYFTSNATLFRIMAKPD